METTRPSQAHVSADPAAPVFEWRRIAVSLTTCCNLHCVMCPVIGGEKTTLGREQAFHIVDFGQRRGVEQIILTGGEPTIVSYFWDLLDRIAETGVAVQVLTNGSRLKPDEVQRLARCPNMLVAISIDGVGPVHDAIREPGSFAATNRTIDQLLEAGCKVAINTTIQRTNFGTMLELYEYYRDYPLEWHGFSFAETAHGKEIVPLEKADEALGILREISRRNGLREGRAAIGREELSCLRLWLKYPSFRTHPGLNCPIPRRHMAVFSTGAVAPCYHYPGWSSGESRNLYHHTLDEIVDSADFAAEIRRAVGPGGCPGCSTMCYFQDADFREKTLHPDLRQRIRRALVPTKEFMKRECPGLLRFAERARRKLGL